MAARQTALTYGRRLARLHHHEYHSLQSVISMMKQKLGIGSPRPLAMSSSQTHDPHVSSSQTHDPHDSSAAGAPACSPAHDIPWICAGMKARLEQLTFDTISPTPSYLLDITLAEYLDNSRSNSYNDNGGRAHGSSNNSYQPKKYPVVQDSHPGGGGAALKEATTSSTSPSPSRPRSSAPTARTPTTAPARPSSGACLAELDRVPAEAPLRIDGTRPALTSRPGGHAGDEKIFVNVLREYGTAEQVGGIWGRWKGSEGGQCERYET
ncbi:hypothetical protein PG994_010028 [Apiospora phragmitis]|uniref:Uncharacterized protein n=1 Tax=Apiospora phragmitis TaxID=2905665 RepID=A0ABR1TNR4_9PEZI